MDPKKIIQELRDLSELLRDGLMGYELAARKVEDPKLKDLLHRFASGRAPMIVQVDNAIRTLGSADSIPEEGTLKGSLHRAWIGMRDRLSITANANVLDECERGERFILERYEAVIHGKDLPPDLRATLDRHRVAITNDLREIGDLRKHYAAQRS